MTGPPKRGRGPGKDPFDQLGGDQVPQYSNTPRKATAEIVDLDAVRERARLRQFNGQYYDPIFEAQRIANERLNRLLSAAPWPPSGGAAA